MMAMNDLSSALARAVDALAADRARLHDLSNEELAPSMVVAIELSGPLDAVSSVVLDESDSRGPGDRRG